MEGGGVNLYVRNTLKLKNNQKMVIELRDIREKINLFRLTAVYPNR
jgi:hypothetical protein